MTTIGFDVISDLNLSPDSSFNWEGKATSLYLIIAGNISNDLRTIRQTLLHLSRFYQGIFYTLGATEYHQVPDIDSRTNEIHKMCQTIKNVAVMHHHVVIVDGIALAGANGWYGNTIPGDAVTEALIEQHRNEDILYLKSTVERLQKHLDVKKIVLVSNSVPSVDLYFKEQPESVKTQLNLGIVLAYDTESKVSHWVYGTYGKVVDTNINDINYINNSYYNRKPYWAKRIEVTI
jgi:hypothetical protein